MPRLPLVSIYVPTKGRPELLSRAVRSALSQDYPALEVVITVDGPDAATEQALLRFADDPRVRVHVRGSSGGACRARNDALALARGELATGLDDDDELLPHHVSSLVAALEEAQAAFACTTSILRRPDGDTVRHAWSGPIELQRLLRENVVGNQVLTKRQHLLDVGGYDAEMPAWQDYDLWVRLTSTFGPGIRVDSRTYLQDATHAAPRISRAENIQRAHAAFTAKHAHLLGDDERASLELLMYATAHRPFPLRRLPAYVAAGCGRRAIAALISDRLPALRPAWRHLRARGQRIAPRDHLR